MLETKGNYQLSNNYNISTTAVSTKHVRVCSCSRHLQNPFYGQFIPLFVSGFRAVACNCNRRSQLPHPVIPLLIQWSQYFEFKGKW